MVIELDYDKCTMCGALQQPVCVERCPTTALAVQDRKLLVTELLCEDCNECGFSCPDKAITLDINKVTW